MKMKRIVAAILIIITALSILSISGCLGETKPVTIILKNSTEYELEKVIFQIPPTYGSYSPMYYLLNPEDESLKSNEEREFIIYMYENDFGNQGWALIFVKDNETEYTSNVFNIEGKEKNRFDITCDEEMKFTVTAVTAIKE